MIPIMLMIEARLLGAVLTPPLIKTRLVVENQEALRRDFMILMDIR